MSRISLRYSVSCCGWEIVASWGSELKHTLALTTEKYGNNLLLCPVTSLPQFLELFPHYSPVDTFCLSVQSISPSVSLKNTYRHTPCTPHQSNLSTLTIGKLGNKVLTLYILWDVCIDFQTAVRKRYGRQRGSSGL